VLVRDDRGGQARAWSIAAGRDVRIRLTWSPDPSVAGGPVVVLEAHPLQEPLAAVRPESDVPIPDAGESPPPAEAEFPRSPVPTAVTPAMDAHSEADPSPATRVTEVERAAASETFDTPHDSDATQPQDTAVQNAAAPSVVNDPARDRESHVAGATPENMAAASSRVREPSPSNVPPDAASTTHVATTPDAPHPHATPDPERPSSGIARWLTRNFSWFKGPRAAREEMAPPAGAAAPAPAPAPAEQQPLPGFESASVAEVSVPHAPVDAAETGTGATPETTPPATRASDDVHATTMPEGEASGSGAHGTPAPHGSHEDALAAALEAAFSGLAASAAEHDDDPRPPRIATPFEPERVFDTLPARIPPTPEPAAVTAKAIVSLPTDVPRDPREIALPDPADISSPPAPAASGPRLVPVQAWREQTDAVVEVDPRTLRSLGPPPDPAPPPDMESDPMAGLEPSTTGLMAEEEGAVQASLEPMPAPHTSEDATTAVVAPHEPERLELDGSGATAPVEPEAEMEAESEVEAEAQPMPAGAVTSHADVEPAADAATADAESPAAEMDPTAAAEPAPITGEAAAEPAAPPRRVRRRHPEWPSEAEMRPEAGARSRRTWIALGAVIVVLFGIGWLVGTVQWNRVNAKEHRGPFAPLLAMLGVRGPTFSLEVRSQPDGAWILVDGVATRQRTPATLQLPPGKHDITLSFGEWGEVVYPVEGTRGAQRHVDGTLWGALDVAAPEPGAVVAIAVDGRPRGFAPVVVDSLAPGPHQVRFSGPGMASWGETVEIRAGQRQRVLARAVASPATGMLEVRATLGGSPGSGLLTGARVWIDGQPRGSTPLTLELPRGPLSVRVEYQGERAPVQVIDLPGGNQRFATFVFGAGAETPELTVDAPLRLTPGQTPILSATVRDLPASDVREIWLHVRGADDLWNRYPMTRLEGQLWAVGAVAFPVSQLDPQGRAPWYVSAVTIQGDEYYTELQVMQEERPRSR
jgi:hypothetical protein